MFLSNLLEKKNTSSTSCDLVCGYKLLTSYAAYSMPCFPTPKSSRETSVSSTDSCGEIVHWVSNKNRIIMHTRHCLSCIGLECFIQKYLYFQRESVYVHSPIWIVNKDHFMIEYATIDNRMQYA